MAYDKVAGEPAASGKSSSTENQGTSKDHDEGDETPSFWVKVGEPFVFIEHEPVNLANKRSAVYMRAGKGGQYHAKPTSSEESVNIYNLIRFFALGTFRVHVTNARYCR